MARNDREVAAIVDGAKAAEDDGRFDAALSLYQEAFERSGQDLRLTGDMGRLALKLGEHAIAERLLGLHLTAAPDDLDSRRNLAQALAEQHRYEEAIDLLSAALRAAPGEGGLWAGLGRTLVQQGRPAEALPFIEEAIRLQPETGGFRYLRANALADLGDHRSALDDYAAALARVAPADRDRVRMPMALSKVAIGDLAGGWSDYRARLSPESGNPVVFEIAAQRLDFDADGPPLDGADLALVAEQGLGDEVMFANIAPDVLKALGPEGRLTLVVEPRLIPLFERSFPQARVVGHRTWTDKAVRHRAVDGEAAFAVWAPMAAPLERFRRRAADFPPGPYLRSDPEATERWRGLLTALPGQKVGLLWKSLKLDGERQRQFAGFELWRPVLETPGVSFVNLQYGDCGPELDYARREWGVEVWTPPGLDLKNDLDQVAALARALDLTIGFSNASINLAGASGAPAWLIAPPGAWTMLGTDAYPWYPQMRVFTAKAGWAAALGDVAAALGRREPPLKMEP